MDVTPPTVRQIAPHGGTLIDRLVTGADAAPYLDRANAAPRVTLNEVSLSDLELIAIGVASPLTGFMDSATYNSVVKDMHLPNGLPWTIPITLPVSAEQAASLRVGDDVALVNERGEIVGLLELSEKFTYDKQVEAANVYRTTEEAHPGVARMYAWGDTYLAGDVWMLTEPTPSFPHIYKTPRETRALFAANGWRRIVAFQTRNPVHRAHEYLMKCALEICDGLMLHPLVGQTKSDDIPAPVRVKAYEVLLANYFPKQRTILNSFPAAMRYAGPREAVFHALCRKNYGCTNFVVGRDHAGVGKYYGTYDSQLIFDEFDPALIGITPLMFEHAFYSKAQGHIVTAKTALYNSDDWLTLSGTQVRTMLRAGQPLPEEFTRPEVSAVLIEGLREL
ncbi:MAG: sulfate adenylyltransferase [Chloroflexi bacterium]|jgi:sulfate adenylyltransferase|nr:sulfate adenylyltransferase [Chloroflexota bacterium]MBV6438251.1 Sulfate adenylyltransferase [Anaerolineae bacterium]MDL1917323.1 sulfate adenylyltransferase [Anaerolineae bacterium CFX4]OQY82214.1 MAG: sulfate adenylyltransferase [Anaerolineae bacterium UTCFX5]MBW7880652.1 sulfate adenylyltransferase [Anaerolineae bacterium]